MNSTEFATFFDQLTPQEQAQLGRNISYLLHDFLNTVSAAYPYQTPFDPTQRYIPFHRTKSLLETWCPSISSRKLYRLAMRGHSFEMLPKALQRLYIAPPNQFPGWFVFYQIRKRQRLFLPCQHLKEPIAKWADSQGLTVPAPIMPLLRNAFDTHQPSCPHSVDVFLESACHTLPKQQRCRLRKHLLSILEMRTQLNNTTQENPHE